MSVWLEMARGERPVSLPEAEGRTDKTEEGPGQKGVLSEAGGFCPSGENRRNPSEYAVSGGFVRSVPMSRGGKAELAGQGGFAPSPAAVPRPAADPRPSAPAAPKPGCMVRLSWSGEWVNADRFAAMSDRERYGPQGKVWCGKCRQERDRETALRCLDGERCQ